MPVRKLTALAVALAAGSLAACGSDESENAAATFSAPRDVKIDVGAGAPIEIEKGTKPKIAFFTPGPLNSFTKAYGDGARAAAERYGVELEEISNGFDASKQFSQLQNELQRGRYN